MRPPRSREHDLNARYPPPSRRLFRASPQASDTRWRQMKGNSIHLPNRTGYHPAAAPMGLPENVCHSTRGCDTLKIPTTVFLPALPTAAKSPLLSVDT